MRLYEKVIIDGCNMHEVDFDELPLLLLDEAVSKIIYSPNGKLIAGIDGRKILLFTGEPPTKKNELPLTHSAHSCLEFHPFFPLLVSGDRQGYIQLWDTDNGKMFCEKKTRSDHCEITAIKFSRTGNVLAWCDNRGTVYIWEIANNKQYSIAIDYKASATLYFINEDSLTISLGSEMRIIDLLKREFDTSHYCQTITKNLYQLSISSISSLLAGADQKHTIHVIDLLSKSI